MAKTTIEIDDEKRAIAQQLRPRWTLTGFIDFALDQAIKQLQEQDLEARQIQQVLNQA